MKSTVLWALIALNAMLATTFVLRMVKPNAAYAQNNRPGDYIMLPGTAIGQSGAMIYIIDQSSQQLSGLRRSEGQARSGQASRPSARLLQCRGRQRGR